MCAVSNSPAVRTSITRGGVAEASIWPRSWESMVAGTEAGEVMVVSIRCCGW